MTTPPEWPQLPRVALHMPHKKPGRWKLANSRQAAWASHLMTCSSCTLASRWPGPSPCAAGARLWRDYLAALPDE